MASQTEMASILHLERQASFTHMQYTKFDQYNKSEGYCGLVKNFCKRGINWEGLSELMDNN